MDIYQSAPGCYLGGEPVFVGGPGSDQGVVICQEFDSHTLKSHFLLFDAHNVGAGATARLTLDHSLYLGFHAAFRAEPRKS